MALFSLFIAKAAVGKTDASASIGEISTKNAEQFNLMRRLSTLENVMSDLSSDGSTGDGMRTETENPPITWIDWQKETQKSQPHDSEHPRENVLDYDNHDSFPKEQYHDHTHDHTYEHSSEHSSEDSTDFVNNDVSDSYPTEDGPFSSDEHHDDGSQYPYSYENIDDYDSYEPSSGQIDHDYVPKHKIQCSPAIQRCCLPQAKDIGLLCHLIEDQLEDCCQMSLPPQRKVDDYHYDDSEAKHPEDHDSKYSYDNSLDSTSYMKKDQKSELIPEDNYWWTTGDKDSQSQANDGHLIGGETDKDGCLVSAGYSWCEKYHTCIPPNFDCTTSSPALPDDEDNQSQTNGDDLVGQKDKYGCFPTAGYTWCKELRKCLRPWEKPCQTSSPAFPGGYTGDLMRGIHQEPGLQVDDSHYDDSEAKHPEDHDSKTSYDNSHDSPSAMIKDNIMLEQRKLKTVPDWCSAIRLVCCPEQSHIHNKGLPIPDLAKKILQA